MVFQVVVRVSSSDLHVLVMLLTCGAGMGDWSTTTAILSVTLDLDVRWANGSACTLCTAFRFGGTMYSTLHYRHGEAFWSSIDAKYCASRSGLGSHWRR